MSETQKSGSVFSMIKLGLILAAYAVVSCTLLAVVNNITAPVIEKNNANKANAGLQIVFDKETEFEAVTGFEIPEGVDKLLAAKKNGEIIGAAVQVTGATFDKSTIIIGLDTNGVVTGMSVLETSDSPGFGQKAADPTYKLKDGNTFYGQFAGKKAADGFIANETFDAITGATITSNGIAGLMTLGCSTAQKYLDSVR